MCSVWSTIQSIFMALPLFDFHNIPWSGLAHIIIVTVLWGNWDSGKLRRASSFGVRRSYEKRGQHHLLEWVGTLCMNTPFHREKGIGLGPKQGEKWTGVSRMWTSWNPQRPTCVPVCLLRERGSAASADFWLHRKHPCGGAPLLGGSAAADDLGLYLRNRYPKPCCAKIVLLCTSKVVQNLLRQDFCLMDIYFTT